MSDAPGDGSRRHGVVTALFVLLAIVVIYLPAPRQQQIASAVRATVLRPFVVVQEELARTRIRATESARLRARLDSLVASMTALRHLAEENRRLKGLLSISERMGPSWVAASVVRPGTAGSESIFLLDVGAEDGVEINAPVITRHGLVGLVREVRRATSLGMDWTHPDFRASAMVRAGDSYGLVESRRGDFREEDRLQLNGTAFHATLEEGTVIVTSGLGGVFPRGIPVGRVSGLAESDAGWRKSYWLEPLTQPGSATHVLVAVRGPGGAPADVSSAWPSDSILGLDALHARHEARRDSLDALGDSLRALRERLARFRGETSAVRPPVEEEPRRAGGRPPPDSTGGSR